MSEPLIFVDRIPGSGGLSLSAFVSDAYGEFLFTYKFFGYSVATAKTEFKQLIKEQEKN